MTTDAKHKLRDFKAEIFFVIVKMMRPDICAGRSYINMNLENMKLSQLKHNTPKANTHIAECINEIYISGEYYSEIVW